MINDGICFLQVKLYFGCVFYTDISLWSYIAVYSYIVIITYPGTQREFEKDRGSNQKKGHNLY